MLRFKAKINKDYLAVNVVIFHLAGGGTLAIDRERTEYTIKNGILEMDWKDCYLWRINDCNIFEQSEVYIDTENSEYVELLKGASIEFEYEDEADEDYEISDIEYIFY